MMSLTTQNFNSLTEAVSTIHSLRSRASRGENVDKEMGQALDVVGQCACWTADDAISLLHLSRMILDHVIHRNAGNPANVDAVLAAQSWMYLDRGITHLEALVQQAQVQNGATVN